jgi:ribonuclease III
MNRLFTITPGYVYFYCSLQLPACQLTLPIYASQPYLTTTSTTDASEVGAPTSPLAILGHLSLFHQLVRKANRAVEWVYSDGEDGGTKVSRCWIVFVLVDGKCLGKGKGRTKKKAKIEAAKGGLECLGVYV